MLFGIKKCVFVCLYANENQLEHDTNPGLRVAPGKRLMAYRKKFSLNHVPVVGNTYHLDLEWPFLVNAVDFELSSHTFFIKCMPLYLDGKTIDEFQKKCEDQAQFFPSGWQFSDR